MSQISKTVNEIINGKNEKEESETSSDDDSSTTFTSISQNINAKPHLLVPYEGFGSFQKDIENSVLCQKKHVKTYEALGGKITEESNKVVEEIADASRFRTDNFISSINAYMTAVKHTIHTFDTTYDDMELVQSAIGGLDKSSLEFEKFLSEIEEDCL